MNKEFLIALAAIFGVKLPNAEEPGEVESQLIESAASTLVSTNKSNADKIIENQTELDRLKAVETTYLAEKATLAESVALKAFKDAETTSLRSKVENAYKVIMGDKLKENDPIVNLVKNASYETLAALNIQYTAQLEEKFPLTCKKCNSTDVNRASATQSNDDDGHKEAPNPDIRKSLKEKSKAKNKNISMFVEE